MSIQNKPNVNSVWASQGGVQVPETEKILEGWIEEIPLNIVANWVENRQDKAILYLFQQGVVAWDSTSEYTTDSLVKLDGVFYLGLEYNQNKKPDENPLLWKRAFDEYGAALEVKEIVESLITEEGALPLYVSKANPVMDGRASAPSFEAELGAPSTLEGSNNIGFSFEGQDNTGMFLEDDILTFTNQGQKVGRLKPNNTTPSGNDLVTWDVLQRFVEKFQIPVGQSIITTNENNPATYYGYGVWARDLEGKALVGVTTDVTVGSPDWVKEPDNTFGAYTNVLKASNLPKIDIPLRLDTWVHGDDASGAGAILTANRNWASGQQYPANSFAELNGEEAPFSIVQPSQTKYIWTRVS